MSSWYFGDWKCRFGCYVSHMIWLKDIDTNLFITLKVLIYLKIFCIGSMGAGHSDQWPENIFYWPEWLDIKACQIWFYTFFRPLVALAAKSMPEISATTTTRLILTILSVLTLALLVAWSRSKRTELLIFNFFLFKFPRGVCWRLESHVVRVCEYFIGYIELESLVSCIYW